MKPSVFLFCLLSGWTYACAQTITVTEQQTEKPLEGAVLFSESRQLSVVTNVKGQAEISAFKEAEEIQIRALGYKTAAMSFAQIQASMFKIALEPASLNLDQVVVSASKWRQSSEHVPSKIISIAPKDAALQNPQTAADLLGISGKVFIQKSQQGGGSPMIRGFATNRLIYAVDGVRMNTAIFRAGNLQNVINLDPFATENREVLFGPGSVIYGSDAIGGVMSFQTLTPQLSLTEKTLVTGKFVTRYESANKEKTAHVDINAGGKKWASTTSFSAWKFDDLRQGRNGPDDYIKKVYLRRQDNKDVLITQDDPLLQVSSAYSQINVMQKVRFKPNEAWDFQYGFHYSATSAYGRYDRLTRFKNGLPSFVEWDYGPQKWMMNHLLASHQGNNAAYDQLNLRVAQQSFEESRMDRGLNKMERRTQTEKVQAYSVNLDLAKSMGSRNNLFYGLEYVLNEVASEGMLTNISTGVSKGSESRYPKSKWMSAGLYVTDEFRVSDKFTAQAGLRYNQFMLDSDFSRNLPYFPLPFRSAKINHGALTGSLGGVYKPSQSWAVRGSFGTGFRSPNVDDMGKIFESIAKTVTVPNSGLKAEYAYNFDLGVAKIFNRAIKAEVSGYYTSLQNAMVRRNFQLNGQDKIMYNGALSQVLAIQNAAVANVYGVQADVEVKLPAGFMVRSDLNYQAGKEQTDDGTTGPSRHAAPLFGVSRLRYQRSKLTLELNAQYQGEKKFNELAQEEQAKDEIYAKDADGKNYSPSWYTLNLKTMYQFTQIFSVSGGIENLTDQRYRPYSSGISGAGINFILSFSAKF